MKTDVSFYKVCVCRNMYFTGKRMAQTGMLTVVLGQINVFLF